MYVIVNIFSYKLLMLLILASTLFQDIETGRKKWQQMYKRKYFRICHMKLIFLFSLTVTSCYTIEKKEKKLSVDFLLM